MRILRTRAIDISYDPRFNVDSLKGVNATDTAEIMDIKKNIEFERNEVADARKVENEIEKKIKAHEIITNKLKKNPSLQMNATEEKASKINPLKVNCP